MNFEWDENKRLSNLEKHGIDFTDAVAVFQDKNRISTIDKRYEYGEIRIKTIGKIQQGLIAAIIHTDRNNTTRLISARSANKIEREQYYGNR